MEMASAAPRHQRRSHRAENWKHLFKTNERDASLGIRSLTFKLHPRIAVGGGLRFHAAAVVPRGTACIHVVHFDQTERVQEIHGVHVLTATFTSFTNHLQHLKENAGESHAP